MKNALILLLTGWGWGAIAQTSPAIDNPVLVNILKGSYDPANYTASQVITDPDLISAGLSTGISADSLKAILFKLKGFQNRNMFSDTVSQARGIGAARRWVYSKFREYSAASGGRLQTGYLQFSYSPANSSVGCPSSVSLITKHSNILAVLPGSQTDDPSIVIVEGHIDSRTDSLCSLTSNAFGIGDNATGTALVMELARVMSKYTFRHTIVFSVNTGEEQGLIGAKAFANYCSAQGLTILTVLNNDVSGGIFCGHTASAPGCPGYGAIDSTDLRIFSLGDFNSPHKQWARYVKLEYEEQLRSHVMVPMEIQIMENEDRTGRGGDHQAFTAKGYTAVRFTQANEDGDASNGTGYKDRQHNIRDSLGLDRNHDGVEDTLYVDVNYLARNTLINGNSMAMVALGPDTITLKASVLTANRVKVQMSPAGAPAYRVAIRSSTNDWDSVYTIAGRSLDTITVPYPTNTNFYISAAAVDGQQTESQFSTEYALTTRMVVLGLPVVPSTPAPDATELYGIRLLPNRPNPFDEVTMIRVESATDIFKDRTAVTISSLDGRRVATIALKLKKGVNEVFFEHGFGMMPGIYICSLVIDGLPAQSCEMLFRKSN